MNHEDHKLYQELSELREQLQIKFYDIHQRRKPTICSEETLKLLVKYKPKSSEDLINISGIGDHFVQTYGTFFLQVINSKKEDAQLELSENEKIILNKLENRLVNINRKNRLLYSSKVNKNYGIDLTKFLEDSSQLEDLIIRQREKQFKMLEIIDFEDDKLKALLKLIRQTEKINQESGNNELYVAYPFVQGKLENENFIVKAPLILFPVLLERTAEAIYLKNDHTRDIIYNTTLILANNKFNGKNEVLPDNAIEEFHGDHYLEDMKAFYHEHQFYLNGLPGPIEKFLDNSNDFPSYKNGELEIKNYMVLGLYSTYVTSMYEDFHKMIQENSVTSLIKELLWGMEQTSPMEHLYEEVEEKKQAIEQLESEINYINELDFSQEHVLKTIRKSDAVVVQGPPGTGKSQTITSIIAQNILQNKTVLMVSEKKTALDVIYSRLGKLSRFALMIDDTENKEEFYQQMGAMIETLDQSDDSFPVYLKDRRDLQAEIREKIETINKNLAALDLIAQKVYGINDFGTSMEHLYHNCKPIDLNNPKEVETYEYIKENIPDEIDEFDYPTLTKLYHMLKEETTASSIDSYLKIVTQHPCLRSVKINLVEIEVLEWDHQLKQLQQMLEEYGNLPFYKKIFYRSKLRNMANSIIDLYFLEEDPNITNELLSNVSYVRAFLKEYSIFQTNQFIYEKLTSSEKTYTDFIIQLEEQFSVSFLEANDLIYQSVLYDVIREFERENRDISNYINHFDSIRHDIDKNIKEKMALTYQLVDKKLLESCYKLNDNGRLNKMMEACNQKRKYSINKFIKKYKLELLQSIKIWLMTPEVVSDIFPFEKGCFDLVIFDEASQLYVERGIPAIYRAKKIVVAGDQKQLKPSSLGKGRILEEAEIEDIDEGFLEYESLLEAAQYKYTHTMLNYHYRSQYEELIAFSNYAFYNGKLMVTSKAATTDKPIERIKVENGRWIDKKNEPEAQVVVSLVKKILNTRKKDETLGVITFNASQMNLIEDLIEKEKMKDPKFAMQMTTEEKRQTTNGEHIGFFVKNIESVQGDERDIIIFCIGYAKNEKNRVAINFGWLNQDGGENRLNVAISRAKSKIYVVTSIEPEELVVDTTKNDGPKLFKEYLRYVKALNENHVDLAKTILLSLLDSHDNLSSQFSFDSEFEEEVCSKLIEEGYEVETQYGVGGYKIDLVIKDKNHSKNLLGIECDGKLYHSSKYARERDYHRQKYLESRGWKIYRIWSPNWWRNPDSEIQKLKAYIDKLNIRDE